MSYNFTNVEKQEVRGDSYKGMSINDTGSYISKSFRDECNLDQFKSVEVQADVANNAILLKFHEESNSKHWKLNHAMQGITLTVKAENINLPKGRYEIVQDNGDQFILKFNPEL